MVNDANVPDRIIRTASRSESRRGISRCRGASGRQGFATRRSPASSLAPDVISTTVRPRACRSQHTSLLGCCSSAWVASCRRQGRTCSRGFGPASAATGGHLARCRAPCPSKSCAAWGSDRPMSAARVRDRRALPDRPLPRALGTSPCRRRQSRQEPPRPTRIRPRRELAEQELGGNTETAHFEHQARCRRGGGCHI